MQGALMVGHNCGGLGKMPGFYFRAELDNVQDMAHRRAHALCCTLTNSCNRELASQQSMRLQQRQRKLSAEHSRAALLAGCVVVQKRAWRAKVVVVPSEGWLLLTCAGWSWPSMRR